MPCAIRQTDACYMTSKDSKTMPILQSALTNNSQNTRFLCCPAYFGMRIAALLVKVRREDAQKNNKKYYNLFY